MKKISNQLNMYQYEKLILSLVSIPKHFVNLAINKKLSAIKHYPDKENLIDLVWRRCVMVFIIMIKSVNIRNKTLYTLVSHQKNKWTIFLDKLNSSNQTIQNTLHIYLFQMLLQELILKEKDYQPFWNPVYKDLSEKLLLPIEIDYVDSDSIYLNSLLKNKEEKLQSSMMISTKALNKNCQKISYQLSTSTVVDKWVKEATKLETIKMLKVPLHPNHHQQKIINEWINTSNYVYNKTLEKIKSGEKPNWINLRDIIVISKTKKDSLEYKKSTDNIIKFKEKYNYTTDKALDLLKKINGFSYQQLINIKKDLVLCEKEIIDDSNYKISNKIIKNFFEQDKLITINNLTFVKKVIDFYYQEVETMDNIIDKEKIILIQNKYKEYRKIKLKNKLNKLNQKRRDNVKSVKFNKNININNWELRTPKEIRTCAVKEVCTAYKTGLNEFKKGKIKHFNLSYRKKLYNQCVNIPKSFISLKNEDNKQYINLAPTFFKENETNLNKDILNGHFLISKKTIKKNKNLKIEHDCKIIKKNNKWWLLIPITVKNNNKIIPQNYCGVDPGIRTFLTTFGNKNSNEYYYRKDLLDKLNKEIITLKNKRKRNISINTNESIIYNIKYYKTRLRKKALIKREEKKSNIIDDLHWKSINDLLIKNDIIFYGDIKSHDIVTKSKNKNLNRSFNDMKFYKFKKRLEYKASINNKLIVCVNEAYTSQTCSYCGNLYNHGCSKIYSCVNCNKNIDRDINAAKNILMKGLLIEVN